MSAAIAPTRHKAARLPIVVVGNGPAAAEAVMAMRQAGHTGAIHLFADNGHAPYNPVLGTYFASRRISRSACFPYGAGETFYRSHAVTAHFGQSVVDLDAERSLLSTADGRTYHYGACLVATGARCMVPPVPGVDGPRVQRMRTLADAVKLRAALAAGIKNAVVVGTSLVGMRVLDALLAAGSRVSLVDAAPQVLPRSAHPSCGARLAELLRSRGVSLHLSAPLAGIENTASGVEIHIGGHDAPLRGDMAVLCLGVRPNVDFVRGASKGGDGGLLVDQTMATGAPGLFAAGDAVQALNCLTGERQVIPLYANARQQGRVAGRRMAGGTDLYPGSVPQNVTHVLDHLFFSIGDVAGADSDVVCEEKESLLYLGYRQGRLWAVNGLDCPRAAGPLSSLLAAASPTRAAAGLGVRSAETRWAAVEQVWPGLTQQMLRGAM